MGAESPTTLGIPDERARGERRVAVVPSVVEKLVGDGFRVVVERAAGERAGYADDAYRDAGAQIVLDAAELHSAARVIARIGAPDDAELAYLTADHVLVALLDPLGQPGRVQRIAETGATALAFEFVPRITRAQAMDALSSQATVAGYHAVLLAANRSPRLFPLLMTAAGTIKARHVLVLGAGVAGLQAIATSRRLGAVVTAFDVRPAVREQVESLGARFLAIDVGGVEQAGGYATELAHDQHVREQEALAVACAEADVVIATAQIPGAPAPDLITEQAVRAMRRGAVIIDLAASTGGNCACTRPDEEVNVDGVLVLGPTNPSSALPATASDLYATNVRALVKLIAPGGEFAPNWDDEVLAGTAVCRDGSVTALRVLERLGGRA